VGKALSDHSLVVVIEEDEIQVDINEDDIITEIGEDNLNVEMEEVVLSEMKLHLLLTDFFDADFIEK